MVAVASVKQWVAGRVRAALSCTVTGILSCTGAAAVLSCLGTPFARGHGAMLDVVTA